MAPPVMVDSNLDHLSLTRLAMLWSHSLLYQDCENRKAPAAAEWTSTARSPHARMCAAQV
jgi:hypothetical protein